MGIRKSINKLVNPGDETDYEKQFDEADLKERLSKEQYHVTQNAGRHQIHQRARTLGQW